jgi:hypothetical protein
LITIQESISLNHISFFNNTTYGQRALPPEIDAELFEKLVKNIKKTDASSADSLLQWYKLDETTRPNIRVLKPISEVDPDFQTPEKREAIWTRWM